MQRYNYFQDFKAKYNNLIYQTYQRRNFVTTKYNFNNATNIAVIFICFGKHINHQNSLSLSSPHKYSTKNQELYFSQNFHELKIVKRRDYIVFPTKFA